MSMPIAFDIAETATRLELLEVLAQHASAYLAICDQLSQPLGKPGVEIATLQTAGFAKLREIRDTLAMLQP